MRLFRVALFALPLAVAACEAESTPPPEDAPDGAASADAPGGSTDNALGQTCDNESQCPSDPPHQCVFLQSGDPNLGYCSPLCQTDPDCTEGYTGPGEPTCFVPDVPEACTIQCDPTQGDAACPEGLICHEPGGPVSFCTTPTN